MLLNLAKQGRRLEDFFTILDQALSSVSTGERLLASGDLNGHVRVDVYGFEGVHK